LLDKFANPDTKGGAFKEWESLLIEQEIKRRQEPKQLRGSLINTSEEDIDLSFPSLPDDFLTVNRMKEKTISFIERAEDESIHNNEEELRIIRENEQPLMGDVSIPYEKLSKEDKDAKALLQEEIERVERERKRGLVRKILSKIKGTSLQGDIEEV